MDIYLHNTLTGKKDQFLPIKNGQVSMYNCGPTVYDYAHIGNLRSYVFADILKRTLEYNGKKVNQIINITDIGHLSSDNDDGEDKMTKALKREGKPLTLKAMREIADFYFRKFKEDLNSLNILEPKEFPFASDHIKENVELIEILNKKEITYAISDGIYFDVSKFPDYGKLGSIKLSRETESRIGINPEKKNQKDFAVWKFNKDLGFDAPFGKGFPGWHIECSAMSKKYLGQPFDIHTGGIDHIPVHHNNEIAQSEVAYDTTLANYWLHNGHLNMGEEKMAKSGGNFITLNTLREKKIDPLALRYLYLGARYSSSISFSWEALHGAQSALNRLRQNIGYFPNSGAFDNNEKKKDYLIKFHTYINDDLDTPKALSLLWEIIGEKDISETDKTALFLNFDQVLGLELEKSIVKSADSTEEVKKLINEREIARKNKDFTKSDNLRVEILKHGFDVKDTPDGQKISISPSASPSPETSDD